jgi:hypothetical protein
VGICYPLRVAPSIGDEGLGSSQAFEPERKPDDAGMRRPEDQSGPDPVIGAGITLLGIFLMGTGGAWDAHYLFDVGVAVAVLGAATFVLCVALSALKQRRSR